jgi:hypothetical protein
VIEIKNYHPCERVTEVIHYQMVDWDPEHDQGDHLIVPRQEQSQAITEYQPPS